jgi:hypothetical protein
MRTTNPMATEMRFPAFLGPKTLLSSRKEWWRPTLKGALGTAFGIFMLFIGAPLGIFVTVFFGIFTIIGVMMLLPRSSSLQLDRSGFETTILFVLRKRYRWRDVSGFAEGSILGKKVVFNAENQHLGTHEKLKAALSGKLNAALGSENNSYLPDTYGMSADDLARLMTSWRDFSMHVVE